MNGTQGIIVQGHRVASGLNGNPDFPGGTIRMQIPYFKSLGLDLSTFYPGTLNIDLSPRVFQPIAPAHSFPRLKWHPVDSAEDFHFFHVTLHMGNRAFDGWLYYPAPETKPKHEQSPYVVELLMPELPGVSYGDSVELSVPAAEGRFVGA